MPFTATPSQLNVLKQAVDEHCRDHGILDPEERLQIAERVSSLYAIGVTNLIDLRQRLAHNGDVAFITVSDTGVSASKR